MIRVEFRRGLRVRRGKLSPTGVEVHAASFLREGRIVLDSHLLHKPRELRRILLHEIFHFVWWKLGNPRRLAWEALLASEFNRRARGELGWSAELRKQSLSRGHLAARSRAWREYCCESFCDTAASLYLGRRKHAEWTLAPTFREDRRAWFLREDIIRSEEDLVQILEIESGGGGPVGSAGIHRLFARAAGSRTIREGLQGPQTRA